MDMIAILLLLEENKKKKQRNKSQSLYSLKVAQIIIMISFQNFRDEEMLKTWRKSALHTRPAFPPCVLERRVMMGNSLTIENSL